jgi:hypothetical protein
VGTDSLDQELSVASVFNGSTWSAPVIVDPQGQEPWVSCPSAGFCVLAAWNGDVVTYSGGTWSVPKPVDSNTDFVAVSCASASFCAAVDESGFAYTDNGGSWSGPAQVETFTSSYYGGLTTVACPAAGTCIAGDAYGQTVTYSGGAWSPTQVAVPGLIGITAISCRSTSFCMASGAASRSASAPAAAVFDGTTWSAVSVPAVTGNDAYDDVSCVSPSFCAVSGTQGTPLVDASGAWSQAFLPQPQLTQSISCAGNDWCAAAGWTDTMLWSDKG